MCVCLPVSGVCFAGGLGPAPTLPLYCVELGWAMDEDDFGGVSALPELFVAVLQGPLMRSLTLLLGGAAAGVPTLDSSCLSFLCLCSSLVLFAPKPLLAEGSRAESSSLRL